MNASLNRTRMNAIPQQRNTTKMTKRSNNVTQQNRECSTGKMSSKKNTIETKYTGGQMYQHHVPSNATENKQ
jgi:hypothetical protein